MGPHLTSRHARSLMAPQVPRGFRGKELPSIMKLVSSLTRMRTVAHTPLASIPFETREGCMELIIDEVLPERRLVAKGLTLDTIRLLRAKPDPEKPDLTLMQTLYDAGIGACPASGMPIFDPSKCADELRTSLWKTYCGIAEAIDDVAKTPTVLTALNELCAALTAHGKSGGS